MKEIEPFKVNIPQQDLDDLSSRLGNVRWPDQETVDDSSQGMPLSYAKELTDYWRNYYDWRRWEEKLNSWDQYTTRLDGINIHFFHIKSPEASARPLIMTHGWPGSIVEFHKVIEPLVNPTAFGGRAEDAFHLVIPSLPGFGFSERPKLPGCGVEQIASMWAELMARLGYSQYLAQGGDWGSAVTECIARSDAAHCIAIHINFLLAIPAPEEMNSLSEVELSILRDAVEYEKYETGYAKQQGTRPQTIGYALADSPTGQMTWIVEKFLSWVDCGNGTPSELEAVITKDELLDNVMMYWLTNTAASAARLYWESFGQVNREPFDTPAGCTIFPGDITRSTRRLMAKRLVNISYWNEVEKGGHFAALEQPELFTHELQCCFSGVA